MPVRRLRTTITKIGLLGRFTLLSLVATVMLGLGLGDLVSHEIRSRALRSAAQSAHLVATFGLQVQLSYTDLEQGLNPETVQSLDYLFLSGYQAGTLAQVEVINTRRRVIYSNNHSADRADAPPRTRAHGGAQRPDHGRGGGPRRQDDRQLRAPEVLKPRAAGRSLRGLHPVRPGRRGDRARHPPAVSGAGDRTAPLLPAAVPDRGRGLAAAAPAGQ